MIRQKFRFTEGSSTSGVARSDVRCKAGMITPVTMVGGSATHACIRRRIEYAAQSDAKVLIPGDNGVGTDLSINEAAVASVP